MNLNFQKLLLKTSLVHILILCLKSHQGFPRGLVVKNLSCNAEDVSLISGRGAKTLRVMEQLSQRATLTEPLRHD